MGRTRGGLNSKLHARCDEKGRPIVLCLSEGQLSDHVGAKLTYPATPNAKVLIGNKGYDGDEFRDALKARKTKACFPPRSNRNAPGSYSKSLCRQRHEIENMFAKLRDWRRIATRYDRCAHAFMSAICIAASVNFWINQWILTLAIRINRKLKSTDVINVLSYLFMLRGFPEHVRSDNGPEFFAKAVQDWIAAVGARTAYIELGSPWENGYIESLNARLRDELLNGEIFYTFAEARVAVESWRRFYNRIRPQGSLGYRPPAPEVFIPQSAGATTLPRAKSPCCR